MDRSDTFFFEVMSVRALGGSGSGRNVGDKMMCEKSVTRDIVE